ncbi:MAG: NAD(+)/NADH kinase [Candidatus Asgardarchaeia archaeon]
MIIENVGIFAKPGYRSIDITVKSILDYFQSKNVNVFLDDKTAKRLGIKYQITPQVLEILDLIITVGGDGTVLYAARSIRDKIIPILTINMGSMGFITEIFPEDFKKAIERILNNNFILEERSRLDIQVNNLQIPYALNELLIKTCPESKLIPIKIFLDGVFLEKFKADGVMIATPTGSTAHALSAGGPILFPSIKGFLILPLNPIELEMRPIVIDDNVNILLDIETPNTDIYLIVDGQFVFKIPKERKSAEIIVRKSKWPIQIIRFDRKHFIKKISEKFGK